MRVEGVKKSSRSGVEGTPLIIIDEIDKYIASSKHSLSQAVSINLFFNDFDSQKVFSLEQKTTKKNVGHSKVKITKSVFSAMF